MCCIMCFDDSPVDTDPHALAPNKWAVPMMDSPCKEPACFCLAFFCPVCSAYSLRKQALENDMTRYRCCQGYFDCACLKAGSCCEESSPKACLALESCCCLGLAVSATRMMVRDGFDLASDPCDNRIIRFNNCVQLASCICDILAIFDKNLRDMSQLLDLVAQLVFYTTQACMTSQVYHELKYAERNCIVPAPTLNSAPLSAVIQRGGNHGEGGHKYYAPPEQLEAQSCGACGNPLTGSPFCSHCGVQAF